MLKAHSHSTSLSSLLTIAALAISCGTEHQHSLPLNSSHLNLVSAGTASEGDSKPSKTDKAVTIQIYDGETIKTSALTSWDQNGSSLVESNANPHSPTNHLRATINNISWFGGVAFGPSQWRSYDMTKATSISFWARGSEASTLLFGLHNGTNQTNGPSVKLSISTNYRKFTLPIQYLAGTLDLASITHFVFFTNEAKNATRLFDIDDIEMTAIEVASPLPPTFIATVYNGETAPFARGSQWDQNGSSLAQVRTAPLSGYNHLRAIINNVNWWGAVGYNPANNHAFDLSQVRQISFWIKSNIPTNLSFNLYAEKTKKAGPASTFPVASGYSKVTLPTSVLKGDLDLASVTSFVFASSQPGTQTYVVDIDDIEIEVFTPEKSRHDR